MDAEALKQEEIKNIKDNAKTEQEDEEIKDLETLILDGKDVRIPIVIEYPKKDGTGTEKAGALIGPVPSVVWTNATKIGMLKKYTKTDADTEILKHGLFTKDNKPFPHVLIEAMPAGAVMQISNKIAEISGIKTNLTEQKELLSKLLGF